MFFGGFELFVCRWLKKSEKQKQKGRNRINLSFILFYFFFFAFGFMMFCVILYQGRRFLSLSLFLYISFWSWFQMAFNVFFFLLLIRFVDLFCWFLSYSLFSLFLWNEIKRYIDSFFSLFLSISLFLIFISERNKNRIVRAISKQQQQKLEIFDLIKLTTRRRKSSPGPHFPLDFLLLSFSLPFVCVRERERNESLSPRCLSENFIFYYY